MIKGRVNKSKTYLLPLLSEIIPLKVEYLKYLKNTYVFDDMDEYQDCIFILHDFNFRNPSFTQYENSLTESELFVDLIDIDNQVLYVFKFPEEYMHEYESYKQGKYSKFGKDAKELILSFWVDVYSGNISATNFLMKVKQILHKDEKLRKKLEQQLSSREHKVKIDRNAELGEAFDKEHETYQLSKIKVIDES